MQIIFSVCITAAATFFLGVGWDWVHLVLQPLLGLLHQLQTMTTLMSVKQLVEWKLAGATKVLGENLPQCRLSTINPKWLDLRSKPGCHDENPATNCLSYGMALCPLSTAQSQSHPGIQKCFIMRKG
jgi:hypothetical protein